MSKEFPTVTADDPFGWEFVVCTFTGLIPIIEMGHIQINTVTYILQYSTVYIIIDGRCKVMG